MSQQELLEHPHFLTTLKRQASFDLSTVERRHVRLRSDVSNEDGKYVVVDVDPEPVVGATKARLDSVEDDNSKLKDDNSKLKEDMSELAKDMSKLRKRMEDQDRQRYKRLKGNCVVSFAEKVNNALKKPATASTSQHSGTRLGQIAISLYERRRRLLPEFPSLDEACFKVLGDYSSLVRTRNEASHETDEEFAALLLTELFADSEDAAVWKKILTFMYGCPLEHLAARSME